MVGHSHGAAMSTGVALGILYYAREIGWDKIALNVIYLASNQPQGLHDEEYENLIDDKVNFYLVNVTQFSMKKKAYGGRVLNGLAEIFSRKYNKLLHNRGIYEHLKAILGDKFEAYKNRCVQFTFTNDRGDMVIRDGDIPEIKSACDPETNTDTFHLHYVGKDLKAKSDNNNPKMNKKIPLSGEDYAKYADYFANRRFEMKRKKRKYRIDKKEEKKEEREWETYREIMAFCMKNFDTYLKHHNWFEQRFGKFIFRKIIRYIPVNTLVTAYYFLHNGKDEPENDVHNNYINYLNGYAALQNAQLYAHFAPVSWINNEEILSDFPDDDYGKISIFDPICKAGKDIFYRIDPLIVPNGNEKPEEEKRKNFKKQFDDMQTRLISTEVGNTEYIKNVIQAYVYNDKKALKKLYKEPNHKKIKPYVDGIYGDQL